MEVAEEAKDQFEVGFNIRVSSSPFWSLEEDSNGLAKSY